MPQSQECLELAKMHCEGEDEGHGSVSAPKEFLRFVDAEGTWTAGVLDKRRVLTEVGPFDVQMEVGDGGREVEIRGLDD